MATPAILQAGQQFWQGCKARWTGRRVRTPTVLQLENTECGAASLSIILQYYGRYVPLTQLRELCGVSRDGSDAANLLEAAKRLGLQAKGFKKGLAALEKLKPPAILFWEFNHFLIFEGFVGDRVALNDPALGPRSVSRDDFDTAYTGIVLTLEPGPDFEAGGKTPSVWPIVLRRLGTEPLGAAFVLLAGLLLILPQLVMPIFAQIYMDEIIGNGIDSWLKPMLWAMALTITLQAVLQQLELVGRRSLEKRLTRRFAAEFEHQVLALPERYYAQRYAADVANRVNSNATIAGFIGERLLPMVSGVVLLVFYLILTLLYSPLLGLTIGLTTGINALVVLLNLRVQKDANLQLQKDGGKAQAVVVSAIRDIETVKAAAVEKDVFMRFAGYQTRLLNTVQSLALRNARIRIIPSALTTFNEVAILLLGFWLVIEGKLTLGMLLAAQTIALSLKGEIEQVIGFVQSLPAFEAEVLRLEDVLEQPRDPVLQPAAPATTAWPAARTRLSGAIELRDLHFGYVPIKPPLITGLNLMIAPGQRIAFVGGSGSGKSTISKLIAGLYLPSSGAILYDGLPITAIPRSVFVGSLAMVQQDIQLYGCSVRDNLTLWNPQIGDNELRQACADAQILDAVLALPDGLDTVLSEGGRSLSGGQRQRLEIARALAQNPTILVLDEATAALDANSEVLVDRALRRRGCTQIIVAHRLSTIRDADLIVVLDQGRVVQQGRHDQLASEEASPYQRLLSETA
ncbi:MAG: NHLP family bacteriocin export ABC transporter peptidase/permease/ATPase subunit [Cyanobacteria bacterium M_surface_9_m1_291]|nr:NHLP family bacteriocin export ABC transporter peptidase/permease/ATPase subunit [Cyanobacteria bacterium M_surface_9_m1_291]